MIGARAEQAEAGALAGEAAGRRWLTAFWRARGWWAGLGALGLAALGQQALLARDDPASAAPYYLAAGALLIAGLLHPARGRRPPANAILKSAARADGRRGAGPRGRPAARHVGPDRALRAAGLALSLGLAGAATSVLWADITRPLGGWLWAAALAALALSFVGVPARPAEAALLLGPEDDFFAQGVPRPTIRWEALLIVGILLVALGLRLVNLEYLPGIFGDEGERGMDARAIVEGRAPLLFGYGWWGVPNLYFYLVAWMLRLFGDSMVGVRMLSVLSGLAAVWFVYRIGRLLWGPRAGLVAGALLAVSTLALQFSRLAGESTPNGALWAGGFLFLFRGLGGRRWADWAFAGLLFGFSLYFYAAGKLIIPLLGAVGLYCLLRWGTAFFRRALPGFLLLGLAFGLTFLPYALFSIKDNWQGFSGRAQETSIFSPQNQPQAFARHGVPYDPAWARQPLVQNVLGHPLPWARVISEQLRVTAEVIYRHGDPTAFYQIKEHTGAMLPPLWAALTLLGLAYAGWKSVDARFGLVSLWFWGGVLGAALTMDTPSVQRLAGGWPALMLFPAALLDRVWAAAWPLSPALARRWASLPLAALLLFFGLDGYREYFVHYASLCPYCVSTVQARYAQALGQEYKGYQLGVGENFVSFGYGSTRFAAKGVEGVDLAVPADFFPITDNNGKGAAFLVYGTNADYLPLIRLFYPGGTEEVVRGADGVDRFTSYKLTAAELARFQTVRATYRLPNGQTIARDEPNLGTTPAADTAGKPWPPPAGLAYPALATWQGSLVAPAYGVYTFTAAVSSDGELQLDGGVVLDERGAASGSTAGPRQVELVLARGIHDVRLSGTLGDERQPLALQWAPPGKQPSPVPARYLYHGPTGGVSGEVWPYAAGTPLSSPDLSGDAPASARRSDPFLGFREATVTFGQAPFVVRWQGTLTAPVDGSYDFETTSNGASLVLIDGRSVVENAASALTPVKGSVQLTAGPHAVDVRYAWKSGPGRMEWYWTPPGGTRGLVPPTALTPQERSWPWGAVSEPAAAAPAPAAAPLPAATLSPAAVLGVEAGLKEPRGVGVDASGQVFIGDSGNHRVVHLDAGGKQVGTWGGPTETSAPGKFGLLADVAVSPDGRVATLDAVTGDVQVFAADGGLALHLPHVTSSASGIGLGPDGRIWVADTGTSRVVRFTREGEPDGVLTGGPTGSPARFEQPLDVAVAPDGTAYVVDLRGRIVQLDGTGNVAAEWPVERGTARGGSHLAVWNGLIVMTDPDRQRLSLLDPASGEVRQIGVPGTSPGLLRLPIGVAAGPGGKLYVVDSDNARVQVFCSLGQGPGPGPC